MTMQQLTASQTSPEVPINENFETLEALALFGRRQPAASGLTWAYYGGQWGSLTIADGTVTLSNSTNYVVAHRTTGAVSTSTSTTNWNAGGTYAKLYQIVASGSVVTSVIDRRVGPGGVFSPGSQGRHQIYVPARLMSPSASGGCAALATIATTANQPDIESLNFDTTTQEFAQFHTAMPRRWNLGTVTFQPIWSHASGATLFGCVWQLQGRAVSDDDSIAASYGTAVTSTDTGGTANDLYRGPESSAITIAGTPAAEDVVFWRVARVPANGSDTLDIDARLHGVVIYITTLAENDA